MIALFEPFNRIFLEKVGSGPFGHLRERPCFHAHVQSRYDPSRDG